MRAWRRYPTENKIQAHTASVRALDRLSAEFVARHRYLPVRQAKSLRNKLAHEYFVADPDILWDTITDFDVACEQEGLGYLLVRV